MSTKFRVPPNVGAANVQIFSSDGRALTGIELSDPASPLTFEAPRDGVFFARVRPIGEASSILRFETEPEASDEISAPERSQQWFDWQTLEPRGDPKANKAANQASELHSQGLFAEWSRAFSGPAPLLGVDQCLIDPVEVRLGLGLSIDTKPMRFGGWRPFEGPWPLRAHQDSEAWTMEIHRSAGAPLEPENARLRLHIAIEKQKTLRLLLPVFLGGVSVTLRVVDSEVLVSVRPLDDTLHLLMQAFSAGSQADPLVLLDQVAKTGAGVLDEDPWALVVFGILVQRKHPSAFTKDDALRLAADFPWLPDAAIIAANLILAEANPNVGEAIDRLAHARRIGAPYLAAANALFGDLLVTLSADAPEAADRKRAGAELAIWRRRIPFQASVGPYFAWQTRGGSSNRGNFDWRYSRPVFLGRFLRDTQRTPDAYEDLSDLPDPYLDASEEA